MDSAKVINQLQQDVLNWIARPNNRSFMCDDSIASIQQNLRSAGENALLATASPLYDLAFYYSMQGASEVLEGHSTGWTAIHRAAAYTWVHLKAFIGAYHADTRRRKQNRVRANTAALNLAHLLALGAEPEAQWLGGRLLASTRDGSLGPWNLTPFEPFMVHLYSRSVGVPFESTMEVAGLGVYQAIFDQWESGGLNAEIGALCDYHVRRSQEIDEDFPEFVSGRYNLLPIEILALRQVRGQMGLETHLPDHPLLATPLASMEPMPLPKDELFEAIDERVEEMYGKFFGAGGGDSGPGGLP